MTHRLLAALMILAFQDKPKDPATTKEAIQRIQLMVGEWRGTGQPKEMEAKAWNEKFNVNMKIDREKDVFQLEIDVKDGLFWKTAIIGYDLKKKSYTCDAVLVKDDVKRSYTGAYAASEKELTFDEVTEAWPRERVVFSLLRDNRFLVEFMKQEGKGKDWLSLAVIGETKEGVPFVKGQGPMCVVTGGGGSIAVEHKGKTYYVC